MITNQGFALIERICSKEEACWECHQVLEPVRDCIIMNECGHMIHESCFRSLQNQKNFYCKSCRGRINMIYILNQIQVVQIHSDGQNLYRKRKVEFEQKISDYFFKKLSMYDELQEQITQKEQEIQRLQDKIQILQNNTEYDNHPQESNSSTKSVSHPIGTNSNFNEQNALQNTVKVKDKVQFYTDLAGLSPQQNIFTKSSTDDSKLTKDIKTNNSMIQESDVAQTNQDFVPQFANKSIEHTQQRQNFSDFSKSNNKFEHFKFSFGNKRSDPYQSPERDTIISVNDQISSNLEDMKTILYSQEQINLIKSFDNQNSQSSQFKSKKSNSSVRLQDEIFSFAKSKQSNSNLKSSNLSNNSLSSQNSSLFRGRIRQSSSEQKNPQSNSKLQTSKLFNSSQSFLYESPKKPQQIILIDDDNQKNAQNSTIINSNLSNKSQNSASKLSDSKIRGKCSSCSKDRHSHPNSDSKQQSENSADRKKRFTADFRLQSLSQARQKLNFFNLQPVSNQQMQKNELEQTIIENKKEKSQAQSSSHSQNSQDSFRNSQKGCLELDQTIIGNQIGRSQQNSQSQNSQDSTTQQLIQKITFNKNARRPHPDQTLLDQQNVCLKLPKYANNKS